MHASGITLPQIVTLTLLRRDGAMAVSPIAERLRMSLSATSSLVQRLVEQQLVTRTEDPDDRRQKRIELTGGGARLIERLQLERVSALGRGAAKLPVVLRSELLDVANRAVAHLRAHV
jgi:DNA-binding MarR family transcriptional regulator